jgi:hypothetical protein
MWFRAKGPVVINRFPAQTRNEERSRRLEENRRLREA